jgi:uncharacterized protein
MFDWDEDNVGHIARHGVTPEEAEEALTLAPLDVTRQYYEDEHRFLQIGVTSTTRVLVVVTTWRGDQIRVITARTASPALREFYWLERGR